MYWSLGFIDDGGRSQGGRRSRWGTWSIAYYVTGQETDAFLQAQVSLCNPILVLRRWPLQRCARRSCKFSGDAASDESVGQHKCCQVGVVTILICTVAEYERNIGLHREILLLLLVAGCSVGIAYFNLEAQQTVWSSPAVVWEELLLLLAIICTLMSSRCRWKWISRVVSEAWSLGWARRWRREYECEEDENDFRSRSVEWLGEDFSGERDRKREMRDLASSLVQTRAPPEARFWQCQNLQVYCKGKRCRKRIALKAICTPSSWRLHSSIRVIGRLEFWSQALKQGHS